MEEVEEEGEGGKCCFLTEKSHLRSRTPKVRPPFAVVSPREVTRTRTQSAAEKNAISGVPYILIFPSSYTISPFSAFFIP